MKCKKIHNNLIFYLEGSLPEKDRQKIANHLEECPDCLSFSEELKKTLGIIDIEKSPDVNPFFYTRVKSKLENIENKEIKKSPDLVRILQPVAFTFLLFLGIYSGIKLGQIPQNENAVTFSEVEIIPFLNEMKEEPIEAFLME